MNSGTGVTLQSCAPCARGPDPLHLPCPVTGCGPLTERWNNIGQQGSLWLFNNSMIWSQLRALSHQHSLQLVDCVSQSNMEWSGQCFHSIHLSGEMRMEPHSLCGRGQAERRKGFGAGNSIKWRRKEYFSVSQVQLAVLSKVGPWVHVREITLFLFLCIRIPWTKGDILMDFPRELSDNSGSRLV